MRGPLRLVDGQELDPRVAGAFAGGARGQAKRGAVERHGNLPCGDAFLAGDGIGLDEPGESTGPRKGGFADKNPEGFRLCGEVTREGEAGALRGARGEDGGGVDPEEVVPVELAVIITRALLVGAMP
mgnify:CR=1 FL=1